MNALRLEKESLATEKNTLELQLQFFEADVSEKEQVRYCPFFLLLTSHHLITDLGTTEVNECLLRSAKANPASESSVGGFETRNRALPSG